MSASCGVCEIRFGLQITSFINRDRICAPHTIGYNSLALPIAAGVFEPFGFTLRPEIAAISMSGSSVLVAVNALALKRLRLPRT